jgi:hypothetical protein
MRSALGVLSAAVLGMGAVTVSRSSRSCSSAATLKAPCEIVRRGLVVRR